MKQLFFIFFSLIITFFSCNTVKEQVKEVALNPGMWRGVIRPQSLDLPFFMEVKKSGEDLTIELINAEERIPLDGITVTGDSIHIPMYIFDADIHARIIDNRTLKGYWIKNYAKDYVVPFEATFGEQSRFELTGQPATVDFSGKWEVDFISEERGKKSIGVFKQEGNKASGTFLTSTGDYRFLEGVVQGNTLKLSTFDGTHAYLFNATMNTDGIIEGEFWSGKTWHQKWVAKRNEEFELPDPYSMAYLKEGYGKFKFSFPNKDGQKISLEDEAYKDKIVIIQILGSWCPNCMDETRFFADWYRKNKHRGVEIIGFAFERKDDFDYASKRVARMMGKLGVDYEVLIAGTTSDESKAKALPMLNKLMSFPTSIYLDKNHKVRKIHTGFSGPGTGDYYDEYVQEFNDFMEKLISE